MRKSRFSDEQVVAILREADREPMAAVAKRHGVSEQTIYTWRKRLEMPRRHRDLASGIRRTLQRRIRQCLPWRRPGGHPSAAP